MSLPKYFQLMSTDDNGHTIAGIVTVAANTTDEYNKFLDFLKMDDYFWQRSDYWIQGVNVLDLAEI